MTLSITTRRSLGVLAALSLGTSIIASGGCGGDDSTGGTGGDDGGTDATTFDAPSGNDANHAGDTSADSSGDTGQTDAPSGEDAGDANSAEDASDSGSEDASDAATADASDAGSAGDAGDGGGAADAGDAGDASSPDGGDGGTKCNALVNDGPVVAKVADIGAFPGGFTGGAIPDDTYVLTKWIDFNASIAGPTLNEEKVVHTGATVEGVSTPNGVGQPELHYTATFGSATNIYTLTLTCPLSLTLHWQYQAYANAFAVYDNSTNREQIYTRQADACTRQNNGAPTIADTRFTTPMPNDAAGGTIATGTYYRTALNLYNTSAVDAGATDAGAPDNRHATLYIDATAGTIQYVDEDVSRPSTDYGAGAFTTPSATTLQIGLKCPYAQTLTFQYTATTTELKVYDAQRQRVEVYTKQ